jgi:hypothetical protein
MAVRCARNGLRQSWRLGSVHLTWEMCLSVTTVIGEAGDDLRLIHKYIFSRNTVVTTLLMRERGYLYDTQK